MRKSLVGVLTAAVILVLASPGAAGGAAQEDTLRVLFVGNSLTTTNDLPATVSFLARTAGRELEVGKVTFDGYSLDTGTTAPCAASSGRAPGTSRSCSRGPLRSSRAR
jgi:hypothetical protein